MTSPLSISYSKLLLISLSLLLLGCSKTQEKNLDPADKQTLDFIISYNRFEANEKQQQVADSIGALLLQKQNNQTNRELLRKYIIHMMPDRDYFYELKKRAQQQNDFTHLGNAHELLGRDFDRNFIKDSTLYNYTKAEMYYRQENDTVNLLNVLLFKGITLLNSRFFSEAETTILEAISYNGLNYNAQSKFTLTMMLGATLTGLGQYEEAEIKILQALVDVDAPGMSTSYNEESRLVLKIMTKHALIKNHIALKQYKIAKQIALESIKKDIDLSKENYHHHQLHAILLQLLSQAKILSDDLDQVEEYLNRTIQVYEDGQIWDEQNHAKTLLAEYFFGINDTKKAFEILEQVLEHAKKHNLLFQEKEALFLLLSNTALPIHDHFHRFVEVSKLINNEAININNTFARIKFESESLILKNRELEAQKKIIVNTSVGLILATLLGFMTYFFRQKSKQLNIVKLLQKDTEKYYNSILAMRQELALAKSMERKKLAQDLHDGVLNKVFVTRFLLMQLTKEDLEDKRGIIVEEITKIETFLRDVSHLLARDNEFKTNSFDTLLQELVDLQNSNRDINFTIYIDPILNLEELDTQNKIHIYRILQEALQNVQKSSKAKDCWITFKQSESKNMELCIEDNGVGFNVKQSFTGIGIKNIKERAAIIKAKLSIYSTINKGTKITLYFNYKP